MDVARGTRVDNSDVSFERFFTAKVKNNVWFLAVFGVIDGETGILLGGDTLFTGEGNKTGLKHVVACELGRATMHHMIEIKRSRAGTSLRKAGIRCVGGVCNREPCFFVREAELTNERVCPPDGGREFVLP